MSQIFRQFRGLRLPVRSLVFLFWIYSLTTSLTSVFIQLFLYQEFSSFALNVLATLIFDTGIAVTFCILGFFASRWQLNIKYGFFWSFILMGVTLLVLLKSDTPALAYLAMGVNGLGNGLFWLTIHTFELSETRNEERDFYSSLLTAGTVIVAILGPALATLLLWLSGQVFNIGQFTLLFIITPLFYLFGFFCFSGLNNYRPTPIEWHDFSHFLTERKNRSAQPYLLATAWQEVVSTVTIPLVVLFLLGGVIQVGLYATSFAVFSALFILALAQYRTVENRLKILGISTSFLAVSSALFASLLSAPGVILYGFAGAVSWPVVRVSIHVTDLYTMESMGRSGKDFYATMIFRDASLWVWRMLAGTLLISLTFFFTQEKNILSGGLYLYALGLLLVFLGASILMRAMKRG
ncbi:MAG: hypothetical protein KGJ34_00290 [Patescibacteria group bacterium]|nr:hypothetical protein [Patescibacteria group bacterium]